MKLKLINFKCYLEKTFEFDDNSFILISASSGSGKSTILMAIQYALYGTGSNIKHYGEENCIVEFEYDGMRIVRTKKNRVVINDIYKDDIAQDIINKKFGDAFNVTSYISQSASNAFISMEPKKKLEFLEKFAFKDINLSEIKNKCKNLINQKKEELEKTIDHIKIRKNVLKELNEPQEIICPFKCKNKDNYEKYIKNEEIKNKNCDIHIKKLNYNIKKVRTEINDLNILNSYIESKTDFINSLSYELDNLSIEESDIVYQGDDKLKEYKERLDILITKKEFETTNNKYKEDVKKLEIMKQQEIEKYEKEILSIDSKIWKEYNKEECENLIIDRKEILKDAKKVSFIEKQKDICITQEELENLKIKLENYRFELDEKKKLLETIRQQGKIYSCPSCKSKLHFKDDKLCFNKIEKQLDEDIDEKEILEYIKILNNKIKKLELNIPNEENKISQQTKIQKEIDSIKNKYEDELDEISIEEDLQILEDYYKTQLILENKKETITQSLKNEEFSFYYKLFEKDVLRLKNKINKLNIDDDYIKEQYSEEELRNIITKEQYNKEKLQSIYIKIKKIKEDNLKYKNQIDELKNKHITKYSTIKNIKELNLLLEKNENMLNENRIKKQNCLKKLEDIEKYNNYLIEKEKYESLKNKINDLEDKEKYQIKKYNAATLFNENILQAESIAMNNIIESINIHAQTYLESFFVDNPIIVKLLTFKQAKKDNKLDKAQINIEIDYKGHICDDIDDLSGGEKSRIVLAFTLALCEMFNSPILLLDECTSNLNQELTTSVFDTIKDNFKSTTVIVVAHQVIEGVFDQIIKLN